MPQEPHADGSEKMPLDDLLATLKAEHTAIDRSHWPIGVVELDIANMSRFGIDENKRLYYDGKMVEVRRRLDLTRGERVFAAVIGLFTIFGAIGAVAQGWAATHQWGCQIAIVSWRCPEK